MEMTLIPFESTIVCDRQPYGLPVLRLNLKYIFGLADSWLSHQSLLSSVRRGSGGNVADPT